MNLSPSKVRGIDSIRFVCAMWVVFGHLGGVPLHLAKAQGLSVSTLLRALNGSIFDGPAAVIVFFVISGFCIHYPYRRRSKIPVVAFVCRRYLRIGLPLLVASGLAAWMGVNGLLIQPSSLALSVSKIRQIEDSDIGVIWSLVCELIYYGLYPLLFLVIRRYGWRFMFATAYALAFSVILTRPTAHSYPAYGNLLTWCVGLPCWLLGVHLAEKVDSTGPETIQRWTIWGWRLTAWAFASAALLLRFHSVVGYPWTLTVFGILCYFWLKAEIQYFGKREPLGALEWAGTWSYSIYLGHELVLPFFAKLGWAIPSGPLTSVSEWGFRMLMVLGFCLVFFWLFEYPAHQLARLVGRKIPQTSV